MFSTFHVFLSMWVQGFKAMWRCDCLFWWSWRILTALSLPLSFAQYHNPTLLKSPTILLFLPNLHISPPTSVLDHPRPPTKSMTLLLLLLHILYILLNNRTNPPQQISPFLPLGNMVLQHCTELLTTILSNLGWFGDDVIVAGLYEDGSAYFGW